MERTRPRKRLRRFCRYDAMTAVKENGPDPSLSQTRDSLGGDDAVDIADPVWLLNFLFASGPPPVEPYPACAASRLAGDRELGCENPPDCQ